MNTDIGEVDRRLLAAEEKAGLVASSLVKRFQNLRFAGSTINTPFFMNNDPDLNGTPYYFYAPKGGKMTPDELEEKLKEVERQNHVDFNVLSGEDRVNFFRRNAIGVDCSGLAYQITREIYNSLGGRGFEDKIVGVDGTKGISRVGVRHLTSELNSKRVDGVSEIKVGDIVRGNHGFHSLVIIGRNGNNLKGVHSSDAVPARGVSVFDIRITEPKKDIFYQDWSEVNREGVKFNERLLSSGTYGDGDGVWRLNILDEAYNNLLIPRSSSGEFK